MRALGTRKIQFLLKKKERKVQNQMFIDSIKFYPRLIEFIEGLIAKKLIFKSI